MAPFTRRLDQLAREPKLGQGRQGRQGTEPGDAPRFRENWESHREMTYLKVGVKQVLPGWHISTTYILYSYYIIKRVVLRRANQFALSPISPEARTFIAISEQVLSIAKEAWTKTWATLNLC